MASETNGVVVSRMQLLLWIIGTLTIIGGIIWYFINKSAKEKATASAVANNIAETSAKVAAEIVKNPNISEEQAKSAVLNTAQVVSPDNIDIKGSVLEPNATAKDLGTVNKDAEKVLVTTETV